MLLSLSSPLVLGSGSLSRAALLEASGLSFEIDPADIDESAIRNVMTQNNGGTPADIAEVLARAKAETVSERNPGALVVGADQVLALGDFMFEKPRTMEDARRTLLKLQGQTHQLHSVVALAREGEVYWTQLDTASLTMHPLSPEDIGQYLAAAGEDVLSSVGAYKLESIGVQLFKEIEGDYFTILGMPLLALLNQFRREADRTS